MNSQDRSILNILQKDGRCSYSDIGKTVGLSTTAVKDRIDKLIQKGSLKNFSATIAAEDAGYSVMAFVFVGIDRIEQCQEFEQTILGLSNVMECHHVTGMFNYLLKVISKDMRELEQLLVNEIKIPGMVSRTETTIVFSSVKHSGFVDCAALSDE